MSRRDKKWFTAQHSILEHRRQTKIDILRAGGEEARVHSPADIVRIDHAIARIKAGQYGLCKRCGNRIEDKRLKSIPEVPHCTPCATELESERRRNYSHISSKGPPRTY